MFRTHALATVWAVVAAVAVAGVAGAESYTTRIEPRPFYGAVVCSDDSEPLRPAA